MTKEHAFEEWLYVNNNEVISDWDLIKQSKSWELFEFAWNAGFSEGARKNVKE